MSTVRHEKDALEIFHAALDTVDPYRLIINMKKEIRASYEAMKARRLLVIGFGKAAFQMGMAVEDSLGDIIDEGILITKYGHGSKEARLKKLKVIEAGHPLPDENGCKGAEEVMRLLENTDEHTLVLCLISGGGSALLVHPYDGISLSDKQAVTELLIRAGANIVELNTVRKHISAIKGGRLAELASPARIISLILSDVIGNRLDVIASGPTFPDKSTFIDSTLVLRKYNLLDKIPESVLRLLGRGIEGLVPETPKEGSAVLARVENTIIGSNRIALESAQKKAAELGFRAEVLSSSIRGEAREIGRWLAGKVIYQKNSRKTDKPCCMITGGETTVTVKGTGQGGRNMELALAFAMEIKGIEGITLLSAGTDGADGPTDAAGAFVNGETIKMAKMAGLDAAAYLDNNDSYNFFKKIDALLITGPTGTNVMDVQIMIVRP